MKKKICKRHKKRLTPELGEFTGIPTGKLECTNCVDNLDFWLPMPILAGVVLGLVYHAIFPTVPEIRYWLLFIGLMGLLLFLTLGSTQRVLKRLFNTQNQNKKNEVGK